MASSDPTAVDLGTDRVIDDLAAEPEHVQEAFRRLRQRGRSAYLSDFPEDARRHPTDQ